MILEEFKRYVSPKDQRIILIDKRTHDVLNWDRAKRRMVDHIEASRNMLNTLYIYIR